MTEIINNALKDEVETLNKKLHELTEEELAQVSGGALVIEPDDFKTEIYISK